MNTRYTKAAALRQAALDYIIANPGTTGPEILTALGWDITKAGKSVGADRLRDMADQGELSRTKAVKVRINAKGHRVEIQTFAYTALVTKTRSAAEVLIGLSENLASLVKPSQVRAERYERCVPKPGVRNENRRPIPNQGGQGAVRHEVRRGCSLS